MNERMNEQQRWSWWSWWWSWWCWVDGLGGWVTACPRFVCTPQTITGALMLVLLLLLSLLLLLLKTSGEYRHQQPIRTHRRTSTPNRSLVQASQMHFGSYNPVQQQVLT